MLVTPRARAEEPRVRALEAKAICVALAAYQKTSPDADLRHFSILVDKEGRDYDIVGIAGVMGGLFAFVVLHRRELSGSAPLFAMCGIAGAVALCFWRDIHGPPTVLGILLAGMMTIFEGRERTTMEGAGY